MVKGRGFLASWNVAGMAKEDILTAMDSQVNGDIIALQERRMGKHQGE